MTIWAPAPWRWAFLYLPTGNSVRGALIVLSTDSTSFHFGNIAPPFAPFIGAAAIAIGEHEIVIEDVIQIAVPVDDHRRIRQGDHSHRRASLRVEVLMPGIEGCRKQTSLLPFERVFFAAFVPDRRRSLPLQDENRLLKHMAHGLELPTRRDLLDNGVASASRTVHVDERRFAAASRPAAEFQLQQIRDNEIFINRNLFPFLINFIRTLLRVRRSFIEIFHCVSSLFYLICSM